MKGRMKHSEPLRKKVSYCEKWLGRIFFMVVVSISSSPAALPADDLSENSHDNWLARHPAFSRKKVH